MSPSNIINSSVTEEHVAKKLKTSSYSPSSTVDNKQEHIFTKGLFDIESKTSLCRAVEASLPYKHCKIDQLVNDTLLRQARKEILENIQFTTKETDIYKVNQTGDLANMDGLPQDEKDRLAHLFTLREGIYSQVFRDFISEVTQCGPLSARKMDMSVNIYNQGCHLLNHDDVIGDRCVSFILYMPDPDDDNMWQPEYGGALELYGLAQNEQQQYSDGGKPANEPMVSLLPQWNQFAFFMVLPGHSFHAVQEVVPKGKSRLSIQGWFHYPQEGEPGYDPTVLQNLMTKKSSLEQLLMDVQEEFQPYEKIYELVNELKEDDIKNLSQWMNEKYLNLENLQELADQFIEKSSLQLQLFIQPSLYQTIAAAILKADEQDDYLRPILPPHGSGLRGSWYVRGSPLSQRYLKLDRTTIQLNDDDPTSSLFHQLLNCFESLSFRKWLTLVSQLVLKKYRSQARRFRPGLDYTLATIPLQQQQSILDVTLSFISQPNSNDNNDNNKLLWQQGDVGGYLCYMACDDDNDEASIYRSSEQDGALLMLPCQDNELSIVLRDEGVMKFVKYVSANAIGSRWDLSLEFETLEENEEK
ncbi:Oxoglutarate and iron-dependent oxygenase degradation C-term-domain-containing protein [Cunninghamella echinulata]|nr:Oxoglutarate and iron-dependent oxygenase degradation C-term-domain-containing protein [Cunninghamella echinulata]